MRLARFTLWLSGLSFIGFGLAFLIAPLQTLASAGVEMSGALAAAELRAFYGGLELGLGLLMLAADRQARHRPYGLILVIGSFGAIGLARALAMALGSVSTPFMWFALGTELLFALLAVIALRRVRLK
jgi:hypothetical protein